MATQNEALTPIQRTIMSAFDDATAIHEPASLAHWLAGGNRPGERRYEPLREIALLTLQDLADMGLLTEHPSRAGTKYSLTVAADD